MKQFYLFTIAVVFLLLSQNSWGQIKLGDSPDQIDPSALLEIESTTKGLLLPCCFLHATSCVKTK